MTASAGAFVRIGTLVWFTLGLIHCQKDRSEAESNTPTEHSASGAAKTGAGEAQVTKSQIEAYLDWMVGLREEQFRINEAIRNRGDETTEAMTARLEADKRALTQRMAEAPSRGTKVGDAFELVLGRLSRSGVFYPDEEELEYLRRKLGRPMVDAILEHQDLIAARLNRKIDDVSRPQGFLTGSDRLLPGMPRSKVIEILGVQPSDKRGAGVERFDIVEPRPGTVMTVSQWGVLTLASFTPTLAADDQVPSIDKQTANRLTNSELTIRAIKGEVTMDELSEVAGAPGRRVIWTVARPSSFLPGDPMTAQVTTTWAWLVDETDTAERRAVYVEEVDGVPSQPSLRSFPPGPW
jgi:hypothetical protein